SELSCGTSSKYPDLSTALINNFWAGVVVRMVAYAVPPGITCVFKLTISKLASELDSGKPSSIKMTSCTLNKLLTAVTSCLPESSSLLPEKSNTVTTANHQFLRNFSVV